MAIYHLSCQTIGRSSGRSAVAAAAYRAGQKLTDEQTGKTHDYTRKREVLYSNVALPKDAPDEFRDRETLWNAAEAAERGRNACVAREFNVALPVELDEYQSLTLVGWFVRELVDEGMCVDFSIHWKEGNPHAHIMATTRPVGPDGFGQKSVTEYLLRDGNGNEVGASARDAKALEAEGWSKLYVYKGGQKLTKSEAEAKGLDPIKDRKRKQPVQTTRYLTDWDKVESLERWRTLWEELANDALENAGSTERIDHRSYLRQGIDQEPSIHEGYAVRAMEDRARRKAALSAEEYVPATDIRAENLSIAKRNAEAKDQISALEGELTEALAPIGAIGALVSPSMSRMVERRSLEHLLPSEAEDRTGPLAKDMARKDVIALSTAARSAGLSVPIPEHMRSELALAGKDAEELSDPIMLAMAKSGHRRDSFSDSYAEACDAYVEQESKTEGSDSIADVITRAVEAIRGYVARLLLVMAMLRERSASSGKHYSRDAMAAEALKVERTMSQPLPNVGRDEVQSMRRVLLERQNLPSRSRQDEMQM